MKFWGLTSPSFFHQATQDSMMYYYIGQPVLLDGFLMLVRRNWVWALAEVPVVVAIILYGLTIIRSCDRFWIQDPFKHARRVAYVFQFLRLLLVAYVVLRQLLRRQMTFLGALLTGSSGCLEDGFDYEPSFEEDLNYLLRLNSHYALTVHILLRLALLIIIVLVALWSERVVSEIYHTARYAAMDLLYRLTGGKYGGDTHEVGVVTRSKSRLLQQQTTT